MISMGTIEELHSHNHTLALYCMSCNRWGEANLDWLIQNCKGDKAVTEARYKCKDCGEIVEKQVRPPVPSLGEAVAYIKCRLTKLSIRQSDQSSTMLKR